MRDNLEQQIPSSREMSPVPQSSEAQIKDNMACRKTLSISICTAQGPHRNPINIQAAISNARQTIKLEINADIRLLCYHTTHSEKHIEVSTPRICVSAAMSWPEIKHKCFIIQLKSLEN